ncbi:DUF4917 family protein [Paenibacillus cineris]|uniref:DUF4917 domain-containing protein n=1 Tax=Paenibacillus cineris TaxID=237530 RepID=A0ABQ4LNR9_9BACL|nr:DUF4917 family protein [Paenibacillus cineris]GIO57900.1 DUF4917 domain-containing protein [Paenibacillus cineris]
MLKKFCEFENPDELLKNILIGNGFSTWFSDRFRYSALLDECTGLDHTDKVLFERLETSNFEACLNALNSARNVNDLYGIQDSHDTSYNRIKNSLIEVIRKVHIDHSEVNGHKFEMAKSLFKKSTNIFTTNYDLLSYWTILKINDELDDGFGDLFYRSEQIRDLHFSEEFKEKREKWIFFLHGALHIYEKSGSVRKMSSSQSRNLLNALEYNIDQGSPPLFVSEGDWRLKHRQIASNPYLRFCMKSLNKLSGSLTIFGHGLDPSADKHIVNTICDSDVERVIYGMYCVNKGRRDIEAEMARIRRDFKDKEVEFFDSNSLFEYTYDPEFANADL